MSLANSNSRGDTIVEVLIALAVLSLAFVISYATANTALLDSQNSQEHSMALQYLDTQVELLRYIANQPYQTALSANEFSGQADTFCLYTNQSNVQVAKFVTNLSTDQYNKSTINISDYPIACQVGTIPYYIAIQPGPQANDFQVWLWWNGLGNLGVQQERLSYRVYQQ